MVILVAARDDCALENRTHELGGNTSVEKPISSTMLMDAIIRALEKGRHGINGAAPR